MYLPHPQAAVSEQAHEHSIRLARHRRRQLLDLGGAEHRAIGLRPLWERCRSLVAWVNRQSLVYRAPRRTCLGVSALLRLPTVTDRYAEGLTASSEISFWK